MTIPEYEVITEVKRERVPVQLPQCKTRFIRDQYCHTFPNGEIECRYVHKSREKCALTKNV